MCDDVIILQPEERINLLKKLTNDLYTKGIRQCVHETIANEKILIQDAQLSQRDRAAGYISFGRKWKTGTQRQYFTDIVSLASTTVT